MIVVSRAAIRGSSIETRRRCDTVVLLPSSSRNRSNLVSTPRLMSSSSVYSASSTRSMWNQGPPSTRKVRGNQLGRLTRSSFSTSLPATSVVSRLYTPPA